MQAIITNFTCLHEKIYSAEKIDQIVGVFVSDILCPPTHFAYWNNISITSTNIDKCHIYFKSANSLDVLKVAKWNEFKKEFNEVDIYGTYGQIMLVMIGDEDSFPTVEEIDVEFVSNQDSAILYTKYFPLSFSPKNILLTYNADDTENNLITFAVSCQDSIDSSKYKTINPNKIEDLSSINLSSKGIKIMATLVGNSKIPVKLHEFSFMVGGDTVDKINQ